MGMLEGKTAIITGASSGIGRETAYAFAREGANIVLNARRIDRLEEVVKKCEALGAKAIYYAGDCREEKTAMETVKLAMETFGHIDILINNAGIGKSKTIIDSTLEDYNAIMDTNVKSAFLFTRYTVPEMLKQNKGQIVMVSSVTGVKGHDNEMIYAGSKFALRGFAQSVDIELKDRGIKACAFCPNAVKTEFELGDGRTQEKIDNSNWLTATDCADAILFVCTRPDNHRVTEIRLAGMGNNNF